MQKWNSSGYAKPTGATTGADRFADVSDGLDTALTADAGTSDPSTGAPATWGADEIGRLWLDRTNERYGSGDDLGVQLYRFERKGNATYGMRSLRMVGHVPVSPITTALNLSAQSQTGPDDLDLTATTSSYAIRALIQVTYTDRAAAISTNSHIAFRPNGVTTDSYTRKVFAQVSGQPVQSQMWCELDAGQILEYTITPSSPTGTLASLRVDVLGYHERV